MRAARLIVLGIAVSAGGLAAILAGGSKSPPPAPPPVAKIETAEVLVVKNDTGLGTALSPKDLQWQAWPLSVLGPNFIRRSEMADAIEQFNGAIVRVPMSAGEPVRESKIIRAKGSGYMAAILPSGMRALSTEISAETGAGGFILPNDRVDVILSRRDREAEKASGIEAHISETILSDIRVLAIDQTIQEKDGQKVVVGKTATLELSPRQTEQLARARQTGSLSLALRSMADADPNKQPKPSDQDADSRSAGRVNMVRFGVTTSAMPR